MHAKPVLLFLHVLLFKSHRSCHTCCMQSCTLLSGALPTAPFRCATCTAAGPCLECNKLQWQAITAHGSSKHMHAYVCRHSCQTAFPSIFKSSQKPSEAAGTRKANNQVHARRQEQQSTSYPSTHPNQTCTANAGPGALPLASCCKAGSNNLFTGNSCT